ncbi:LysR family transcriptional regulator [Rhodoferax sp. U11-2br]|uniref:LysR family transcriptional regulator n=1 Tax=Rhodoferax sp. U11-2br TaxID=2838878 RepID=UPI001BEAB86C|nr:LysR family transcriptional regulator [Rhodoferax sp. U11-2br]MBT3069066.1 LysR family transcriptional regulator [Rhodoferax sp. U11-2br]
MDIRGLRYFIVTAQERNISRAAERLHMTQPPLTRHIQALEEELGVQLFTRTSAGVELTQAGEALLGHAHNISSHVELATEHIRRVASGQEGRIDIGIFGSPMLNAVPRILGAFSRSRPKVNVVLHNAPKLRQLEALRQGRIMVAFDRYFPESPELESELVVEEPLWVALNQRNPLALKTSISLADLAHEPLIGEQDQSIFFASPALSQLQKVNPLIVHKAADMVSAVVMVSGGFGSALVPESVLNLKLPELVFRPLAADSASMVSLHCIYRKDESSPLLAGLLACVRDYRHQYASGLAGTSSP